MLLLLFLLSTITLKSLWTTSSYISAVVEYQIEELNSSFFSDPIPYITQNLDNYAYFVKMAAGRNADIIVFPEYGITSGAVNAMTREQARLLMQVLPVIGEDFESHNIILERLSSMAKLNRIYVVANLPTMSPCENSETNNECFYNTNVAFNRDGQLVSSYRKFHLYGDKLMSKTSTPDISYFDTDFGMRIGMLICFDINYPFPAQNLLDEKVDAIAFSSAWYDGLPFLTAIQYQYGWSWSNGIPLLASGSHNPKIAQLGSGIYSGNSEIVTYTNSRQPGSKLLLSTDKLVVENNNEVIPFLFEDISRYNFERLIGNNKEKFIKLNYKDELECSLTYKLQLTNNTLKEEIVFGIYSGTRIFGGKYVAGIQNCAVLLCDSNSCGKVIQSSNQHVFEKFSLSGIYLSEVVPMPVAIDTYYQPLLNMTYQKNGNNKYTFSINTRMKNVYSIALYGRNSRLDE